MRGHGLVVLLVAVVAWSASGQTTENPKRRSPVMWHTSGGIDLTAGMARIAGRYVQTGDGMRFEAERPSTLQLVAGKGEVVKDATASGGICLAHIQQLTFRMDVATAGKYQAWYRGWFPWAGTWVHTECMDGGANHQVMDSKGETLNTWLWSSGPIYELTAGSHEWSFTPYAWMGGARLDTVALLPVGQKPADPMRPLAPPKSDQKLWTLVSKPIASRRVVRWDRLELPNLTGLGKVTAEVSTDGAKSWLPVGDGGSLAKVPAEATIAFRVRLALDAAGGEPWIGPAEVHYEVAPAEELVLADNVASWRFSGIDGALLGITNLTTNTAYMDPEVESPLLAFKATHGGFGAVESMPFSQFQLEEATRPDGKSLRLAWSVLDGTIHPTLTVRLGADGLSTWSLEVVNQSELTISEVLLPTLAGLRIGDDPTDDFLCQPILTGGIVQNPARVKLPRMQYSDRPLFWPGMATMCWTDLYDPAGGGLYLAWYDREIRLTELTFAPGGHAAEGGRSTTAAPLPGGAGQYKLANPPGHSIHLGFNKRISIPPGATVTLPDVVMGVHQGDWHWGADRYREWAASWMLAAKQTPAWLRDTAGWTNIHQIHLGDFVDMAKGRPIAVKRLVTMRDPPFLLIAQWAQMVSCEAHWATPVLHLGLGTERQFTTGIEKQHELGHRWISYDLPPRINPTFHKGSKRNGMVPIKDLPPDEVPPDGFFEEVGARMYNGGYYSPPDTYCEGLVCMGHPAWRDYLEHIVADKYIDTYGCDGMYLDGMGLVSYECKDLAHGHGYGEWHQGFIKWLSTVKARARASNSGAVFAGEGMGDVDHQYLDLGLFYFDNSPQVYRYTIPWNIGVIHGAKFAHYKDYPGDWYDFCAVFGLRYGGVGELYERDPERFLTYLKFVERFQQFQSRARFMDEVGVTWGDPAVKGKLYVRDEKETRGALLMAFNEQEKPGMTASVSTAQVGKLRSAWAYTLDGELHPVTATRQGDTYTFELPTSRLTAVFLLERCEPFIDMGKVAPTVRGESGRAPLTLRYLGPGTYRGKLSLDLADAGSARFRLRSGESADFSLAFSVPAGMALGVHDLTARVTRWWHQPTERCLPIGVSKAILAELNWQARDQVELALENLSGAPRQGTVSWTLPEGVTLAGGPGSFSLDAHGAASLVYRLNGTTDTRRPIEAQVHAGEEVSLAQENMQPEVINGDFEQCRAGDGWPDWWNYRRPQSLYLQGAALDTEIKHGGRQSLRIDPNPRERDNYVGTSFVRLVPGKRYRVSAWIRRSANEPNVSIQILSFGGKGKDDTVNFSIGQKPTKPAGEWEHFEQEFTAPLIKVMCMAICNNPTWGKATAWYDDVRFDPLD